MGLVRAVIGALAHGMAARLAGFTSGINSRSVPAGNAHDAAADCVLNAVHPRMRGER